MNPAARLQQAIYYLDRQLAPSAKIRAFQRAVRTVSEIDPAELESLVDSDQVTMLDGIGSSTGTVITNAVRDLPCPYLADLEVRSRIPAGPGAAMRELVLGDCHAHTTWSDGGASVEVMARAARDLGHQYLVITDHSARLTIAHGLDAHRLEAQIAEIATINQSMADDHVSPFRILTGLEVDIFEDGSLDMSDDVLGGLDLVVASVHSKLSMDAQSMTRRLVEALANPNTDVLGHCTGRKLTGQGRPPSNFDAEIVFGAAAQFGKAIEINCRPERQDPPDDLIDAAQGANCLFAINTDAHAPGQLEWQPPGCSRATAAGVDPALVINTWTADDLLAWTGGHRQAGRPLAFSPAPSVAPS